ncbi:hypothetical protein C7N83_07070 [Neisseria iguanae]|uniref:Uncharacterized protein n=1 Tax=Neisseria iguanae TaxID=90242 RepID=A0A2P7U000_9NEIS|nr:hypothetical protein C7N83_07070 [Neisseria iguanae]
MQMRNAPSELGFNFTGCTGMRSIYGFAGVQAGRLKTDVAFRRFRIIKMPNKAKPAVCPAGFALFGGVRGIRTLDAG